MLKSYKDTVNLVETTKFSFDFNKLRIKHRKYYGKLPNMYLQIDPLTFRDLEFDNVAYAKLSLSGYSEDKIINNIINYLTTAQNFYQVFIA